MKLVKAFPRNSITSEKLGNIDILIYFKLKGTRWKTDLRWFRLWIWQSTW